MTMYYRFTDSENPMSEWGHAMFSAAPEENANYGERCYTFDDNQAVAVTSIADIIVGAAQYFPLDDYGITPEDLFEALNPEDIVDSAQAYDNPDMISWFWESVIEPNDIKAVITQDGAVVFDSNIIFEIENEWI